MRVQGIVTTTRRAMVLGSLAAVMAIGLTGGADPRTKTYAVIQPPPLDFQLCMLATNRYMDMILDAGQNPGTISDRELDAAEAVMKDLCYTAPPVNAWD